MTSPIKNSFPKPKLQLQYAKKQISALHAGLMRQVCTERHNRSRYNRHLHTPLFNVTHSKLNGDQWREI